MNAPIYPRGEISREPAEGVEKMAGECFYRSILLISVRPEKAKDPKRYPLRQIAVDMATRLRAHPGVRHVEAIGFADWQPDPAEKREPPWKPWGALLFVEAGSAEKLEDYVRDIFSMMEKFDPDRMRLSPMDSF